MKKLGVRIQVTEETLRDARVVAMQHDLHVSYDVAARLIEALRLSSSPQQGGDPA